MDSLTYKYDVSSTSYTNKLVQVRDSIGSGVYTVDVDDQGANNYDYDAIGNLTKDDQEEIASIEWTVYGKIRKVNRISSSTKDDLEFRYDPIGNRICKISKPRAGSAQKKEEDWTYTYYVRDAQGNAMAVYNRDVNVSSGTVTDKTFLKELDIYGSSRVGMKNCNIHTGGITYTAATPNAYDSDGKFTITGTTNVAADAIAKVKRIIRKKTYELTNHLGNVIVAVSDKKIGVSTSGTTLPIACTYYLADVQSANDYYSFGMLMEGRQYSGSGYRYGFNGKEKDDEVKGVSGSSYDFGARIYDPRVGRFLSVDPDKAKYSDLSPYCFAANNSIVMIDAGGRGPIDPKTGKRISSNVFNVATWSAIYVAPREKSPGPYSHDEYLVQAAHALANASEGGDIYNGMREKDKSYYDRVISRPYSTVLAVNNETLVLDLTQDIRTSIGGADDTKGYQFLEKAGESGNYVFVSENWVGKDFSVYTVKDGWIDREAKFSYNSKSGKWDLATEKTYTTVMSEVKTRYTTVDTPEGTVTLERKYREVTSYENISTFDENGKLTDNQTNTYKYEVDADE